MASPASGPTNIGVAPNVGGLLCYIPCCIGFLFSIMVAIVEKQSRFVRFHAFQSLLVHGAAFVVAIGLYVVQILLAVVHLGALGLLISLFHLLDGQSERRRAVLPAHDRRDGQQVGLGPAL